MKDVKNRIISYQLIGMVIFLSLFFLTGPAAAQDEAFDKVAAQPTVYGHINIDAQGKASTDLTLMPGKDGFDAKDAQEELTAGLQETLQCTLDNVRFNATTYFWINADCRIPAVKNGLVTQVRLNPSALQSRLNKRGSHKIKLSVTVPRLGHNSEPRGLEKMSYGSIQTYSLDMKPGESTVQDITLSFGYSRNYVIALAAVTLIVLIVPIVLILVVRRRSLMLAGRDATAAWFGYWRVHRWIVEGIWLVWLILFWTFHVDNFIGYLSGSDQPVLNAFLIIVPPGIVSFMCQYLARPLWLQVRGIAWNKREMLVRGFWEHVAAILPFVFILIGISYMFQRTGQSMLWFAAAFVTMLFGAWMHGKVSKTLPSALHGGELHEKILAMAERAGVKIQQVFLMPSQHLQMGNAFAMQGRKVMITDYLLERLTKKETDCVMAHEIGHVKKRHTLLLSWMGFLFIFLIINVMLRMALNIIPAFIPSLIQSPQNMLAVQGWFDDYLVYPLSLLFTVLIRYPLSRRCESSADEFATLLTGDPENMITSLVKLSKMNLMPISWGRWDERLSTHPATLRRVELIARNHRISTDRLKVLLDTEAHRPEGLGYTIPEEVTNTGLIFSTERKTRIALVNTIAILLTVALLPLLLGISISRAGLPAWAYAAGIVIVPVLYIIITAFISVWGYGAMKRELAAKLAQSGAAKDLQRAHFVGLVPEEYPRHYDGHTVWDVGFLRGESDALVYSGDKSSFCIPRERIISIAQGPSFPGLITIPETYIRWNNGEKEGVLHLHSQEGHSLFEAVRQSKGLLSRLIDWQQGRFAGDQTSKGEAALALPAFSDVKGVHPNASASLKNVFAALMLSAFLVFGFSFLLGLDNNIAWYGFGVASGCLILGILPAWRYKDGPKQSKPV